MWILESTGDLFQGKRMWLKPGKNYLFGRVKKDGVRFAIDHKTVSRKHFIIAVDQVKDGDVGKIHARTKITIVDQSSKSGTSIDGELLKGEGPLSRELKNDVNSVRPGTCPEQLIIRWQPCVLTYNLMKKEIKSGALKIKQDRVKELDIKVISEFVADQTTHVVVNKRNTPKGLQALINGKYLVTEAFVDALEYATTPADLDDEDNLSPLESDFETHWPQPRESLPPPGREPTARSVEYYEPDPSRNNIFEDCVFVFGEQNQFDNLLPVITSGHGKALFLKVVDGQTAVEDVIVFMQNAAGEKNSGNIRKRSGRGGVIMVRWIPKNQFDDWTSNLINQVALKLDQRAVDQAEFLDAILANDATLLRQPIPYESTNEGTVAPPPSLAASFTAIDQSNKTQRNGISREASSISQHSDHTPSAEHSGSGQNTNGVTTPTQAQPKSNGVSQLQSSSSKNGLTQFGRRPRYQMPQSTLKEDFDDGFDPDAIAPYDDDGDEPDEAAYRDNDSIKDETGSVSSKRQYSEAFEQDENDLEDDMDELAPAAAAMKRRKLAIEAEARRKGIPMPTSSTAASLPIVKKPKKKEKEIDVREIARAKREKEAEAARRQQEDATDGRLYENDTSKPANLVKVVQFELPVRDIKSNRGKNPEDDPRWDPRWNGKKNFKKFQPQADGVVRRTNHSTKVIVPLVMIKPKTNGLGDRYWEKPEEEKERERRKKAKSQRMQSQNLSRVQNLRNSGEAASDSEGADAEGLRLSHNSSLTELEQEARAFTGEEELDLNSPRRTRASDQVSDHTPRETQASKRSASSSLPGTQAKKRQKTLPVTVVHGSGSDDDDSDDMKFRFGSRAKRGQDKGRT